MQHRVSIAGKRLLRILFVNLPVLITNSLRDSVTERGAITRAVVIVFVVNMVRVSVEPGDALAILRALTHFDCEETGLTSGVTEHNDRPSRSNIGRIFGVLLANESKAILFISRVDQLGEPGGDRE